VLEKECFVFFYPLLLSIHVLKIIFLEEKVAILSVKRRDQIEKIIYLRVGALSEVRSQSLPDSMVILRCMRYYNYMPSSFKTLCSVVARCFFYHTESVILTW